MLSTILTALGILAGVTLVAYGGLIALCWWAASKIDLKL